MFVAGISFVVLILDLVYIFNTSILLIAVMSTTLIPFGNKLRFVLREAALIHWKRKQAYENTYRDPDHFFHKLLLVC